MHFFIHFSPSLPIKDHLTEFTWTELEEHLLPDMWSNNPVNDVWADISKWAHANMDHELVPKLALLKGIFEEQEKRGVDREFHEHLDAVSETLAEVMSQLQK
jgi:hypothetical protein